MKKLFSKCRYMATTASAALVSLVAGAQNTQSSEAAIKAMTTQVKNGANEAVNLISVLVGLIAIIMLAWNYFKRSKGDGQSNDALASWGWGLIIVIIGLQVVKVVFL